MIPKKIHCIWLGGRDYDKTSKIAIESWYRVLHDYQIEIWNENRLDIDSLMNENRFLKECHKRKLWAFMSDYLRLYILYNYGGIYMDTDVEVLRSMDDLLINDFFIGYEADDYIGTGIIGAKKGNRTIKRLLDFYDSEIWNVDYYQNPIIFKKVFDSEPDILDGCVIYPQDFFSPYNPKDVTKYPISTIDTYCIHWYNSNWGMSRSGYVFLKNKHIKGRMKRFIAYIRRNIGYLLFLIKKNR